MFVNLWKNNSIFVDIVIVNNENEQYSKIINKEIEDEKYRMYSLNSFYHTPGSITVIDGNEITINNSTKLQYNELIVTVNSNY